MHNISPYCWSLWPKSVPIVISGAGFLAPGIDALLAELEWPIPYETPVICENLSIWSVNKVFVGTFEVLGKGKFLDKVQRKP